jgi:hypothetical protein
VSARTATKPERLLYEAAEEYARLKANGGFTSSEDMERGRRQLRWAARRFTESDTPIGTTLRPPHDKSGRQAT